MAKIIWAEPAIFDLNEIAEYIALDKQTAAKQLTRAVFAAVDQRAEFPEMGRKVPELEYSHYRELIVGPCRIFYRFDDVHVYVLYVMRSERLLRNFILDDRSSNYI